MNLIEKKSNINMLHSFLFLNLYTKMFLHWSCICIMKHKKICKCKTTVEFRNINANVSAQMRPSRLIRDCWWNKPA